MIGDGVAKDGAFITPVSAGVKLADIGPDIEKVSAGTGALGRSGVTRSTTAAEAVVNPRKSAATILNILNSVGMRASADRGRKTYPRWDGKPFIFKKITLIFKSLFTFASESEFAFKCRRYFFKNEERAGPLI